MVDVQYMKDSKMKIPQHWSCCPRGSILASEIRDLVAVLQPERLAEYRRRVGCIGVMKINDGWVMRMNGGWEINCYN